MFRGINREHLRNDKQILLTCVDFADLHWVSLVGWLVIAIPVSIAVEILGFLSLIIGVSPVLLIVLVAIIIVTLSIVSVIALLYVVPIISMILVITVTTTIIAIVSVVWVCTIVISIVVSVIISVVISVRITVIVVPLSVTTVAVVVATLVLIVLPSSAIECGLFNSSRLSLSLFAICPKLFWPSSSSISMLLLSCIWEE